MKLQGTYMYSPFIAMWSLPNMYYDSIVESLRLNDLIFDTLFEGGVVYFNVCVRDINHLIEVNKIIKNFKIDK